MNTYRLSAALAPLYWSEGPKGLFVSWGEIERILDRRITPDDFGSELDALVLTALAVAGAPKWIRDSRTTGFVDESGYYLDRPKVFEAGLDRPTPDRPARCSR